MSPSASARAIASRFSLYRRHLNNAAIFHQSSLYCCYYSTSATKTRRNAATSTSRLKNQPQKPIIEQVSETQEPPSSPKSWSRFSNLSGIKSAYLSLKLDENPLQAEVDEAKSKDLRNPGEHPWQAQVGEAEPKLKDLPKPTEIPWQAKVVNSVNLIGHVQDPVQFREVSGGKYRASTTLVQGISQSSSDYSHFSIPIVFEGDLAHVAACHLKVKDHVYVAGQLSVDPNSNDLEDGNDGFGSGNIHLQVSSFNFVHGYNPAKKKFVQSKQDEWDMYDVNNCLSNLENDASLKQQVSEQVTAMPHDRLEKKDSGAFGIKENEKLHQGPVSRSELIPKKQEVQTFDRKIDQNNLKSDKFKDSVSAFDSWKCLLSNPKQWRDYRQKKADGSVNPKYPDFKHKDNAQALWLENAPKWVLEGIDGLEFDDAQAQVMFRKSHVQVNPLVKKHKNEAYWKDLVENPDKWWDNRSNKSSAKAPDFKHKDSGEGLWLNASPDWVLSRLPPLRPKQNASVNK